MRACLEQLPACKARITRLRADASGLLACQKILKIKGLAHDSRAQCEPLIDTMPSAALRQEFRAYLDYELKTATTLGLEHVGVPISSDALESLCGVAKQHGVGETQDAARIAFVCRPSAVFPLARKPGRSWMSAWPGNERLQARSSP